MQYRPPGKATQELAFEIDDQMCMATAPPFKHNKADYDRHIKAGFALCQTAVRDKP